MAVTCFFQWILHYVVISIMLLQMDNITAICGAAGPFWTVWHCRCGSGCVQAPCDDNLNLLWKRLRAPRTQRQGPSFSSFFCRSLFLSLVLLPQVCRRAHPENWRRHRNAGLHVHHEWAQKGIAYGEDGLRLPETASVLRGAGCAVYSYSSSSELASQLTPGIMVIHWKRGFAEFSIIL